MRGRVRRVVHHTRSARLGNEHESGADVCERLRGARLDSALDLFSRAASGDADSCGDLSACAPRAEGAVRETGPLGWVSLHFLQIPRTLPETIAETARSVQQRQS